MTKYLIKQFFASVIKLILFLSLMFFVIQWIMPGDFVDQFAMFLNRAERENLRESLGLDLPMFQQYWLWISGIFRGDLGLSGFGFPVSRIIELVLPPTLLVFIPGTLIAFGIGMLLGKWTAWRGKGVLSGATTLAGISLFTAFPPWLAWLVAYFFGRQADVSRGQGGGINNLAFPNISRMLWIETDLRPREVALIVFNTALIVSLIVIVVSFLLKHYMKWRTPWWAQVLVIAGVVFGLWYKDGVHPYALDILSSAALPLLTYILLSFGDTMIIMQSSMTEVLKEEYIKTAQAKGLPQKTIRERHAARNALLPVLSRLFISLPFLLAGIVIIEDSVNWPGMGGMIFGAMYWQDIPTVMGVLLIIGVLALVVRLFLDVMAAYLDPRIRFDDDVKSNRS
ncbi:MAG: ABC transporter permease [Anaerolineales bacterium]|nr:ABC transporter permease [Chloroflexota bacterium]MBL6982571.1 ABC transporter permease [Anaerolineales bacterium]